MSELNPVWENEIYVGTEYTEGSGGAAGTWTYAKLCKGIESVSFTPNEQNQQYFFLCGNGFAHNEVTGGAPELTVSGRRIAGDAAQDFICGKQFALGNDRNTSVKIVAEGKQIICDATIGDVTSFGGNTLDINSFGCTIRLNGEPTITDAT
jgi:hypothetical protein